MTKILCVHHHPCQDGFASAWAVRKFFEEEGRLGDVTFHAGVYQEMPPNPTGLEVILVDFSYKREVVKLIADVATKVTVIDHHKTAIEDLTGLDTERENIRLIFDLERSGAGLTWDTFFPRQARPDLIDCIEDRDLWKFEKEGTKDICAAVFTYPYDFDVWDDLMENSAGLAGWNDLKRQGAAVNRKAALDMDGLLTMCKRRMRILEWSVPVIGVPYPVVSEICHIMAQGEFFAAGYQDTAAGRKFSLRSAEDGIDVSAVAKQFGGGGHKHAAGFTVPRDHPLAMG
jgi:oligoribonuclease NrnB/cAMP/cGMP phosphodiesterase (DHH superfamily)